jgi:peptide/nickel transport system substrate-binding protein
MLYDTLVRLDPSGTLSPGAAAEWTPNSDHSTWTFRLRPDVEFHNGKSLTADDLIYSFHFMSKPGNDAGAYLRGVKFKDIKKLDASTVEVPLMSPNILFPYLITDPSASIIQNGETNFTHPVGTGPFMYKSFTPGQQSVFDRNPNYWEHGKPYVDSLVVQSISDDTARLNALLSGRINAMAQVPYTEAKVYETSSQVKLLKATGANALLFYMRVDLPPFNDNRVRQAMKSIVNRPSMVNIALNGFGSVANDLIGKGLPFYDDSLPQRVQDLELAKSLLRQAGKTNLSLTLYSSPITPGVPQAAVLFQEEASSIGVKVHIKTVPADDYFNPSLQYLKMPFASSVWTIPNLPNFYSQAFGPPSKVPYNETHYNVASFNNLLSQALGASSVSAATRLWDEVQKAQWEDGGYIVWGNPDLIDAVAPNVHGIVPAHVYDFGAPTGPINAWIS